MNKHVLILAMSLLFSSAFCQTEITVFNSSKLSNITRVAAGDNNDLYLGGYFSGSITVNSKSYSSENGKNFIGRMDASGKILWFIQTSATVLDLKYSTQGLLVLGFYNETVSILSKTKTSQKNNFILCNVSSDGLLNWITGADSNTESIYADGIALDPAGNIFLLGSFDGSVTIGEKSLSKKDDKNAFLAKFNKSGTVQWLSQMTGGDSYITGIWTDAICYSDSSHIYVTGYVVGPCTFGTKSITTKAYKFTEGDLYSSAVFVATYDDKGVCNDVKKFVTEADVKKICTDASGNIILAGHFKGNVTDEDYATSYFGTEAVKANIDPAMSGPSEDAYVAKFTSSGQLLWVAHSLGTSYDRAMSVAVGSDGSVYACGFFDMNMGFSCNTKKSDLVQVTGTTSTEQYAGDLFVVKYTADGELDWFKPGGGTGADMAEDLIFKSDKLYVSGRMSGNVKFDGVSKQIGGINYNAFIIKM
jgi:hypothetical protein